MRRSGHHGIEQVLCMCPCGISLGGIANCTHDTAWSTGTGSITLNYLMGQHYLVTEGDSPRSRLCLRAPNWHYYCTRNRVSDSAMHSLGRLQLRPQLRPHTCSSHQRGTSGGHGVQHWQAAVRAGGVAFLCDRTEHDERHSPRRMTNVVWPWVAD